MTRPGAFQSLRSTDKALAFVVAGMLGRTREASFRAGSSPSLGDVVGDAGVLLRPRVQAPQARPARHRVTRSRVLHRHISGTAGQHARGDDQR